MKVKSPVRRTQAERTAATRAQLLKAARKLFADRGFGEVSTQAIVEAAGVTRGALYHQFADKNDLFAALYEQVEEELAADVIGRIVGVSRTLAGSSPRSFFGFEGNPYAGPFTRGQRLGGKRSAGASSTSENVSAPVVVSQRFVARPRPAVCCSVNTSSGNLASPPAPISSARSLVEPNDS